MLLAEALLRFTPVMAMNASGRTRWGAILPVLHSFRFGLRHIGNVTWHVWLLRLACVAAYSLVFILPVVLSQEVMPFKLHELIRSVKGNWSVALTLACHALIMAVFTAFGTVYDARLVMHVMHHRPFGENLAHDP